MRLKFLEEHQTFTNICWMGCLIAIGTIFGFVFFLIASWFYPTSVGFIPTPEIIEIADDLIKEKSYSFPDYVCRDSSLDLIQRLKDKGYKAAMCHGDVPVNGQSERVNEIMQHPKFEGACYEENGETYCGHAWVKVEVMIESIGAMIIDMEDESYILDYCENYDVSPEVKIIDDLRYKFDLIFEWQQDQNVSDETFRKIAKTITNSLNITNESSSVR